MSGRVRAKLARLEAAAVELRATGCDECRGRAQVFTTHEPRNPERDEPEPPPQCPRCGADRLTVGIVYRHVTPAVDLVPRADARADA